MRTVTIYHIDGVSKAKTAKAILVEAHGKEAWIPLSVASARFTGPNYKVRVSVPGWLYNKISWKIPSETVAAPQKKKNPYIGTDYGNMMEERMVLEERLSHEEYEYDMYQDSDDFPTLKNMADEINSLKKQIAMIDEAVAVAHA